MDGSKMFLYWGSGSTPCWRVMIVLEEKGLERYGHKQIDFVKGEHKCEEILFLNHRGQVPTFTDDGHSINESHAICDYLEQKYQSMGNRLLPEDTSAKCRVLQRMHEAHNNFQQFIIQNIIYYCWKTDKSKWDPDVLECSYTLARKELKIWDEYLKTAHEEGQDYIAGNDFTMADVYLYPHVAFCVRFGLDISKYPDLKLYYETLQERESIRKTWPPDWRKKEQNPDFLFLTEL